MASRRAGRVQESVARAGHLPVPPGGTRRGRTRSLKSRRRAALGLASPAHSSVSTADGEVAVRYEAVYRKAEAAGGERRLLLAVLEDGIRTFLKHAQATFGRGLNLRRETLGWMMAAEARDVFAFESICETLGINAEKLRRRILTASTDENLLESLQ